MPSDAIEVLKRHLAGNKENLKIINIFHILFSNKKMKKIMC